MSAVDNKEMARWVASCPRFRHPRTQAIIQAMIAGRQQKDVAREHYLSASYVRQVYITALQDFQRRSAAWDQREWATRPVAYLDLSRQTTNALMNNDVKTIRELTHQTPAELLRFPNFGRGSLQAVVEALAKHGLGLSA